jgi:hypothetical protein
VDIWSISDHRSRQATIQALKDTVKAGADAEAGVQATILRDILGNPFRLVPLNADWLKWNGGTVEQIARDTYEARSLPGGELPTSRLSLLADALEDAGCTDIQILEHLRGPASHVRGCWVIDALLAKS